MQTETTETTDIQSKLGLPLTLKEICELHNWNYSSQTNTVKRLEKQLNDLYDYSITGKGRNKRYILHNTKKPSRRTVNEQGKTIGFGKQASQQPTKQTKKSTSKRKQTTKHYTDYVYTGELIDEQTIQQITDDDMQRHNKYTDLVEVGKDYTQKELCDLFSEQVETSGRGRTLQLSKWWQSFEWIERKQSGKPTIYTITKVYDEVRPRINDSYKLEHFKEQQLEVNFIMSILDSNNLHEEVSDYGLITGIKARDFYKNIGLVNGDYYKFRSKKEILSDWLQIDEQRIIYRDIDESSKRYTLGALKRLLKQRVIIDYSYTYLWYDKQGNEHIATDKEHLAIENAIKETIKYARGTCGFKVYSVCNLYDNTLEDYQQQDLYKYLMDLVKVDIPKISYYCRGYKLIYLKEPMLDYVYLLAKNTDIDIKELGMLKRDSSHKEHTQIQVGKVNKRIGSESSERQIKLINTVVDLPRDENIDDRKELTNLIDLQEQIDELVKQERYAEAEQLMEQQAEILQLMSHVEPLENVDELLNDIF